MFRLFNKVFSVILFIIPFSIIQSQEKLAVYYGIGTGVNIGGEHGVGIEYFLNKNFSINSAVGVIIFPSDSKNSLSTIDKVSIDIGVKLYPINWAFVGINYGFLDFNYSYFKSGDSPAIEKFKKHFGFSVTAGIKLDLMNNFYVSGYIGTTPYEDVNCPAPDFLSGHTCYPRLGFLVGYNFN